MNKSKNKQIKKNNSLFVKKKKICIMFQIIIDFFNDNVLISSIFSSIVKIPNLEFIKYKYAFNFLVLAFYITNYGFLKISFFLSNFGGKELVEELVKEF